MLPYFHLPFEIEIYASDYSLGTIITQSGHPIAFHYEKELYAIVQALKQWRHYILGKEMIILAYHEPLQFALS